MRSHVVAGSIRPGSSPGDEFWQDNVLSYVFPFKKTG